MGLADYFDPEKVRGGGQALQGVQVSVRKRHGGLLRLHRVPRPQQTVSCRERVHSEEDERERTPEARRYVAIRSA